MKFKVFHCIAGSDLDDVEADDAVEMEHADIYTKLFGRLEEHEDFFGMVDAKGVTFQAMYHAEKDRYWFEIPVEDEGGSYGAFFDFDDAVDIMKTLPETFSPDQFPALEFEAWDPDDIVED